jgi:hypothetical protein
LLLSRDGSKKQRRAKRSARNLSGLAEKPRGFQADGNAGRIIIGTRSIEIGIHYIRSARIEMAGHDHQRLGQDRIASGQNPVDIFKVCRLVVGSGRGGFELVDHDLKFVAGGLGNFVQPVYNCVSSASGAALRVCPRAERVASGAGNKLFNERAHARFIDLGPADSALRPRQQLRR